MTGYVPNPPAPWVPTATNSETKLPPAATVDALKQSIATDVGDSESVIGAVVIPASSKGAAEGVAELDEDGIVPDVQLPERLTAPNLSATFAVVRTSDGHPLAPGTIIVITLDKTLSEITTTPAADIADITFEEV